MRSFLIAFRSSTGLAVALLVSVASPALAGEVPVPAPGTWLALTVTVNGEDRGLAEMRERGGHVWAALAALRALGLTPPADTPDPAQLDTLKGVSLRYQASEQALALVVPVGWLNAPPTIVNLPQAQAAKARSSPGMVLNYDSQANFGKGGMTTGSLLGLRAFAGSGLFETTQSLTTSPAQGLVAMRYDTSLTFSFPDQRLTVRLGDTVTSASDWSRQTRIGGLQIGTDFSLQPYLITVPVPAFFGSAVLPSSAEVYIDGMRSFAGQIPPGPFQIGLGPSRIDGAGNADLVLTNILGQVTTIAMPVYETPLTLRRGLSEWSAEVGTIRRRYGISAFSYAGDPVASASWRRGLTDRLTLIAHGEASGAVANLGCGAVLVMGQAGVVTAAAAHSRAGGRDGNLLAIGYSWAAGSLHIAGSLQRASSGYADLASTVGEPQVSASDLAQISWSSPGLGNIGAHYLRRQTIAQPDSRYAGVFVTKPFGQRVSLYLSADQNLLKAPDRRLFLTLSLTPGRRLHASLDTGMANGTTATDANVQNAPAPAGGLGWRVAGRREGRDTSGSGELDWLNHAGEARLGAAVNGGLASGYLAYSGSLALMPDGLFVGRRINASFAVVATNGIGDVPVTLENRVIGRTNAQGTLLVSDLNAYQRNRLGIDVTDLPAGFEVESLAIDVTPAQRAGVTVHFPLHPFSAVLMTLVDRAGVPVPPGTAVLLDGSDAATVGFDGQLYIERPASGERLVAQTASGACHILLPDRIVQGDIMRLGKTVCAAGA